MTGFESALKESQLVRAKISFWIRRNQPGGKYFFDIDSKNYKEAIASIVLPDVAEQADLLLLLLGDELKDRGPGSAVPRYSDRRPASIGALNSESVDYLFDELRGEGLLGLEDSATPAGRHRLTFNGWRKYDALKRGKIESGRAFMAMPYGNSELDKLYKNYYVPSVKEAGFSLWRLDEEPKAGLIDNNMLIAVRNSRFVVAEITDENAGAVWEAGYAEGEGKTVIYSCKESYWKERHFDLRNRQTVRWSSDNMEEAAEGLKACIRATFPGEARSESDASGKEG